MTGPYLSLFVIVAFGLAIFIYIKIAKVKVEKKAQILSENIEIVTRRLKSEGADMHYNTFENEALINEFEKLLTKACNDRTGDAESGARANLVEEILIKRNIDRQPIIDKVLDNHMKE
ncbi:MAG TPA: hypothetical protein VEG39_03020 [Clostridia bacterium]|nr:hypothetical protein [Clostridia bacterium]